jgi:hypothetical protein
MTQALLEKYDAGEMNTSNNVRCVLLTVIACCMLVLSTTFILEYKCRMLQGISHVRIKLQFY